MRAGNSLLSPLKYDWSGGVVNTPGAGKSAVRQLAFKRAMGAFHFHVHLRRFEFKDIHRDFGEKLVGTVQRSGESAVREPGDIQCQVQSHPECRWEYAGPMSWQIRIAGVIEVFSGPQ